jgi:hypothetical protein
MLSLTQESFLPCPGCSEIIASNAPRCKYCNASVDPQAAAVAAHLQQEVNQACHDARMARNAASLMWIAFAVLVVAVVMAFLILIRILAGLLLVWAMAMQFLLAVIGQLAFIGIMVALPLMLIRWQSRYGRIKTNDVDFKTARRNRNIALLLWLPAPVVIAVGFFIFRSWS